MGCKLIGTCPRGLWFAFSTEPIGEGVNKIYMQEEDIMTPDVLERKVRANGQEIMLALTFYQNGQHEVSLLASLIHKRLTMDFVTVIEHFGTL